MKMIACQSTAPKCSSSRDVFLEKFFGRLNVRRYHKKSSFVMRRSTPDSALSIGKGTRMSPSNFRGGDPFSMRFTAYCQNPFRQTQSSSSLTMAGRGYSAWGRPSSTSRRSPHVVSRRCCCLVGGWSWQQPRTFCLQVSHFSSKEVSSSSSTFSRSPLGTTKTFLSRSFASEDGWRHMAHTKAAMRQHPRLPLGVHSRRLSVG
mmetsp:Transcript_3903/g.13720  ORF Transcript_3903/g.13720 Transcript_3903/m.13720 type:complete len:203 (-) Transcript_3903:203-811(-)